MRTFPRHADGSFSLVGLRYRGLLCFGFASGRRRGDVATADLRKTSDEA
ncbi:hypothetical protein [Dyella sp. ASV21]|nr:hypothetical protein [Dyella sp. ASV21]